MPVFSNDHSKLRVIAATILLSPNTAFPRPGATNTFDLVGFGKMPIFKLRRLPDPIPSSKSPHVAASWTAS